MAVFIARANIGTSLQQQARRVHMPTLGCLHQRRPAILVRSIYICAFFDQQARRTCVSVACRLHQRRPLVLVSSLCIASHCEHKPRHAILPIARGMFQEQILRFPGIVQQHKRAGNQRQIKHLECHRSARSASRYFFFHIKTLKRGDGKRKGEP